MSVLQTKTLTKSLSCAPEHAGYVRLPLSFFRSKCAPDVHLYTCWGGQTEPTRVSNPNMLKDDWQFDEIRKAGHDYLYVQEDEYEDSCSGLLEQLERIVHDDSYPSYERFLVLQSVVSQEIDRAFRSTNSERIMTIANRVGAQIAYLTTDEKLTPPQIFGMARHDSTTFVHGTNVAAYAVMLAEAMGQRDTAELQQIAVGGILHDLGKRTIPQNILVKQGRLTAKERDIIERHPQLGYEALCNRGELSFGQLMMIYQHHEWIDGSGYPVAVLGDEIHPWAKLLAVVDVFDAMTANRPYRIGMSPTEVIRLIADRVGSQFENEPVRCWISLFQ